MQAISPLGFIACLNASAMPRGLAKLVFAWVVTINTAANGWEQRIESREPRRADIFLEWDMACRSDNTQSVNEKGNDR
jgi:hypothetical protein